MLQGRQQAEAAGFKPGDEGRARPLSIRAKPGSGQEPTRVESGPGSACAAEGAPDCMGAAWPKPSDSGEGIATSPSGDARVGPGAHSGGVLPRFSLRSRRRARLHGRCRAEAERRRRRGCSLSLPGEAWIG